MDEVGEEGVCGMVEVEDDACGREMGEQIRWREKKKKGKKIKRYCAYFTHSTARKNYFTKQFSN